jgi:hypothetical protein
MNNIEKARSEIRELFVYASSMLTMDKSDKE